MALPISRFLILLVFLASSSLEGEPMGLVLPTDNDAIFSSDPSQFYMYTDRNFEGVVSKPWSGGAYGFTRNQKRTSAGIVMTRLHEGIDIRPLRRDASGEPLDEVRAISKGTVVYVSDSPGASNYGRYIVVHHDWGYGPFFSLYAHLKSSDVAAGETVEAGAKIGGMGYTGAGINKERAHVHVELNMILSDQFKRWYDRHFTTTNRHGIFNGFNLVGMDIAGILIAHRANPSLTIPEYLATQTEVHYKVLIPKSGELPFLRRYPFLARDMDTVQNPTSWEISFAATGVPVAIRPSDRTLSQPVVTFVKPSTGNHADLTVDRLTGTGDSATLSPSGSRYMQLISDSF
ncbi:MAG: M23 family metallopeptidase [Verrucomicrobiales bacterium]|jgi:murein DD-endopeptidase MepM/ murein hydrolase activator NlpD|nr:M23 family metallopeptidase [Verrucomicrobiales bacterium]